MTGITTYTTGAFCWADLTSPDQPASKAFYSALFGWDGTDNAVGEGMTYSDMELDGKAVAGVASNMPDQADAPASWGVYVNVESADAAVERARSLGATVEGEGAFDVFEFGRMAALTDPAGTPIRVWEAHSHIGAQVMGEPGSLAWFELSSGNPDAAVPFYREMFDWTIATPPGVDDYLIATTAAGEGTAGIVATPAPDLGWLPVFGSDDVDASAAAATQHGASEITPATDIQGNMGRYAILRDPQGAAFGLYKAPAPA